MSNTFGKCKTDTVTWFKTFDETGCAIVTFYPPGQTVLDCPEPEKICTLILDPVKGAVIVEQDGSETEIPVVDGVLQLPYDMFGTVELSGTPGETDYTASVTLPGQEPFDVCLVPVKTVTGDGVDNADPQNPVITQGTVADQENGLSGIVTDFDGNSCEFLKASAYEASGSTAVPSDEDGDGVVDTHTITTSDGLETPVCLNPVKSVSGPFVDNTDPQNPILGVPADLRIIDIRIVESPDGTYNWEVDVGPGDGTVTETLNAGPVIDTDTFGTAVVDEEADTTTQTNPDGTVLVSCNTPVKSVTGDGVDNTDPQNPVISASAVDLVCPDGSNKATLQVDEGPVVPLLKGLLKCSDAGPVALDCDVDEVRVEGRVRAVRSEPLGLADFDPACIPVIEPCDKEGDTVSFDGVTFEVIGGAWLPISVSPRNTVGAMNDDPGGTTTIDDAAIGALTAAWEDVDCLEETYTNTDCVTHTIKASVRGMFQADGAGGNLWSMRLFGTGFSQGNGAPDSLLDVTNGEPYGQQKDYGEYNAYATVLPGASVTLRVCFQARVVNANYVSDPQNSLGIVGLTGRFEISRSA